MNVGERDRMAKEKVGKKGERDDMKEKRVQKGNAQLAVNPNVKEG